MIRQFLSISVLVSLSWGLTNLPAATLAHKPLTGFQALEVAARVVAPASKNQVLQIEGPRSETELYPDVWKFVFWDANAKQNGRLITVSQGAVTEIRDGFFELDKFRLLAYKPDEVIPPSALKFDSDKALDAVLKSTQLQGIRLSSVTFSLSKDKEVGQAVWKIEILADDGGKENDIGYARVSAETGGILEMKINPGKLKNKT